MRKPLLVWSFGLGLVSLAAVFACANAGTPDHSNKKPTAQQSAAQNPEDKLAKTLGLAYTPDPFLEENSHPKTAQGQKGPGLENFWVRPGYKLTVVATDLGNARFMIVDPHGTLYLSRPDKGDILMLRPKGNDYAVSGTFVTGYVQVHGLAIHGNDLWFTSAGRVSHAPLSNGIDPAQHVTDVLTGLPQGGHWWRSILVTQHHFYTSIGDSGNINDDTKDDREKIWRYNLDGSGKHMFSSGIRNTEKLLIRPGTDKIYGCDQGSDWFGQKFGDHQGYQPITDWNPPEEFNNYVDGGFYGHPFVVGNRIPRQEYANRPDIDQLAYQTIPPAFCFGPHWAADGWTFLNKAHMAPDTNGSAVVAFHGSWNRSIKSGYRVDMLKFDPVIGTPDEDQLLVGFCDADGNVLGRPVDVTQAPDGSLLISDDQTNRIYRLQWIGG